VCSGSGTARIWSNLFGPIFQERFGIPSLWPGTLNLLAKSPVLWENPSRYSAHEFCPIILEECAIGVVLRLADPARLTLEFLEVLSPVALRPRLGNVQDGQEITVRLLSGDLLERRVTGVRVAAG
jgi:CTP-dependent riboflavin kinase